jgi:glycosyl-4,4'-diaponeurosporenoate acyltransferase
VSLPIWVLSDRVAVLVDIVVWAVWGGAVGYAFHRMPVARFTAPDPLTRIRSWERGGRWWADRLAIRRWKDRLPEAGALFAGGFSKRRLATHRRDHLERFVAETRRAEWVHWTVLAIAPAFLLWNPPWLAAVMVAYGVAANLPCILVQRYNRGRLERILDRAPARLTADDPDETLASARRLGRGWRRPPDRRRGGVRGRTGTTGPRGTSR